MAFWIPLLKALAMSQLSERGAGGKVGSAFLGQAWNKEKSEKKQTPDRLWTFSEDEGIPGIDIPTTGKAMPYNANQYYQWASQQYPVDSFWNTFFRALMGR